MPKPKAVAPADLPKIAVPAGTTDPTTLLLISELDGINAQLGADVIKSISESTAQRWQALALVAFTLARREDPKIKLARFRELTILELTAYLDLSDDDDDQGPGDEDELDPTA